MAGSPRQSKLLSFEARRRSEYSSAPAPTDRTSTFQTSLILNSEMGHEQRIRKSQNKIQFALHAAPADRTSTYLVSAFLVHSTSFLPKLLWSSIVTCVMNVNQNCTYGNNTFCSTLIQPLRVNIWAHAEERKPPTKQVFRCMALWGSWRSFPQTYF